MEYRVTLPGGQVLSAREGEHLLSVLRQAGFAPAAPCGGQGRCGKCTVYLDGVAVAACRTAVDRDMTVALPEGQTAVLTGGIGFSCESRVTALAFDIGTTTVAGWLLRSGKAVACRSCVNPQRGYGADVVSRIRAAVQGHSDALTAAIRGCIATLARQLCADGGLEASQVEVISAVGNPAMMQLLLGICPENLAHPPFRPVLTKLHLGDAGQLLPEFAGARLLTAPAVAGFVGADTLAGILATGMDRSDGVRLLVDIGTNGEMALGDGTRMVVCSTAAGPALEGAGISCGMSAMTGAIDRVWAENGALRCHVIGGGKAEGICGSGLVDGVAAALELGLLNERGRILNESRCIPLTDGLCLTQEDIRAVQSAKGAIAAGIRLMAKQLHLSLTDIETVYLAGAFGAHLSEVSACRIGLLPPELAGKLQSVGNAAGTGAQLLALEEEAQQRCMALAAAIRPLELGAMPEFAREFAGSMRFTL